MSRDFCIALIFVDVLRLRFCRFMMLYFYLARTRCLMLEHLVPSFKRVDPVRRGFRDGLGYWRVATDTVDCQTDRFLLLEACKHVQIILRLDQGPAFYYSADCALSIRRGRKRTQSPAPCHRRGCDD